MDNSSLESRLGIETRGSCYFARFSTLIAAWICLLIPMLPAQDATQQKGSIFTIEGKVVDTAGKPVSDAEVWVERERKQISTTKTNAQGSFSFSRVEAGNYVVRAERAGISGMSDIIVGSSAGGERAIELTLADSVKPPLPPAESPARLTRPMEFTDTPNFAVAGVTDWTAAGGHGSDSSLRTSEALVRETLTLKAEDLSSGKQNTMNIGNESAALESKLREAVAHDGRGYEANHELGHFYLKTGRSQEAIRFLQAAYDRNPAEHLNEYELAVAYEQIEDLVRARQHVSKLQEVGPNADWESLAGEVDEKLGDPLKAVHEFEQATLLTPSETNYFNWGSELLLHRAVLQATEVFEKGVKAYPQSLRMLSALGAALFANARYDEAALRLCEASDLNPADPKPYEFMARINMAAPGSLPCIREKLGRFQRQQPDNSLANYFFAMAIWKARDKTTDESARLEVEVLLTKAVKIDNKCAEGYLQLGNLASSQIDYGKAIGFYKSAISANPQLAEAHYRLGVAYDRSGKHDFAVKEFQLHDEIKKSQANEIEKGRREVKQFLVVNPNDPISSSAEPKLPN